MRLYEIIPGSPGNTADYCEAKPGAVSRSRLFQLKKHGVNRVNRQFDARTNNNCGQPNSFKPAGNMTEYDRI